MSLYSWIDPRARQVRVEQVRSYLLDHGWRLKPVPRPQLLVFEGPLDDDGNPNIQILPSSEKMLDYRMRVEELIGSLGVLEDRYAGDVMLDILKYPAETTTPTNGVAKSAAVPAPKRTRKRTPKR